MSAEVYDGFQLLGRDFRTLLNMAEGDTLKAALHAGGEIVVAAVKAEVRPHNRTGTLEESIAHQYDAATQSELIGWGGEFVRDGFYGRMMETGFTTRGKKSATRVMKGRKSTTIREKGVRYIDEPAPHMRPGYEKSKWRAADAMAAIIMAAATGERKTRIGQMRETINTHL